MSKWTVVIPRSAFKPDCQIPARLGVDPPQFSRTVIAPSRVLAFLKVLPDLQPLLPQLRGTYTSVFVGSPTNPSLYPGRLEAFQLVNATGERRLRGQ